MVTRSTLPTRRAMTERATALVLVPTMMLVLVALAAVAVDLTAIHAAQRSLYRTVSAAADDAAGMVDRRRIQQDGVVVVDPEAARRVVRARLATADLPGTVDEVLVATDARSVEVTVRVRIEHLFLGVVPGVDDTGTVPVRVRARLVP